MYEGVLIYEVADLDQIRWVEYLRFKEVLLNVSDRYITTLPCPN